MNTSFPSILASLLVVGSSGVAIAQTPIPDSTPDNSVPQLFRRTSTPYSPPYSTPGSCGPQGCRLSIDQTLLRKGDVIRARYVGKDQQIFQTGETREITLNFGQALQNRSGQTVIPAESVITGDVVPAEGGGRFVAKTLTLNGRTYNFVAQSGTLHDVKDPRQTSIGAIATDAAIGAAGGVVLGQVFQHQVTWGQIVGGGVAGAVVGNVTAPRAVVIDPNTEIPLQLNEDFRL